MTKTILICLKALTKKKGAWIWNLIPPTDSFYCFLLWQEMVNTEIQFRFLYLLFWLLVFAFVDGRQFGAAEGISGVRGVTFRCSRRAVVADQAEVALWIGVQHGPGSRFRGDHRWADFYFGTRRRISNVWYENNNYLYSKITNHTTRIHKTKPWTLNSLPCLTHKILGSYARFKYLALRQPFERPLLCGGLPKHMQLFRVSFLQWRSYGRGRGRAVVYLI